MHTGVQMTFCRGYDDVTPDSRTKDGPVGRRGRNFAPEKPSPCSAVLTTRLDTYFAHACHWRPTQACRARAAPRLRLERAHVKVPLAHAALVLSRARGLLLHGRVARRGAAAGAHRGDARLHLWQARQQPPTQSFLHRRGPGLSAACRLSRNARALGISNIGTSNPGADWCASREHRGFCTKQELHHRLL